MIIGISGKKQSGKDEIGKIIQYLTSPNSKGKGTYQECKQYGYTYDVIWQIKKFAHPVKQILSIITGIPISEMESEATKLMTLPPEWDRWRLKYTDSKCWYEKFYATQEECEKAARILLEAEQYYNNIEFKKSPITIREALQWIGTNLFRDRFHPNTWVNAMFTSYESTGGKLIAGNLKYTLNLDSYPNWIITDVRFPNEVKAIKDRGGIVIRVNRNPGINGIQHESETALDNYTEWDYIIENDSGITELVDKVTTVYNDINE